ncbi:hypothetical protein F4781DRAFT_436326 [Annulohypoxylon bovei var. microspora]|nr:hypothetical protein F4781DRAFT_436326 [Annulohypoxylon bovei var. microspora]
MSSNKNWSQDEKISFLVQALQSLTTGNNFPYDKITLPGRSKRSMVHAWYGLRGQSAAYKAQNVGNEGMPEARYPLGTKKPPKRKYDEFAADDDKEDVVKKEFSEAADVKGSPASDEKAYKKAQRVKVESEPSCESSPANYSRIMDEEDYEDYEDYEEEEDEA